MEKRSKTYILGRYNLNYYDVQLKKNLPESDIITKEEVEKVLEKSKNFEYKTIHKSKGLEYPAVLIPVYDDKLDENLSRDLIWLDNPFENLQDLKWTLMRTSKNLRNMGENAKENTLNKHIF